ncbi:MAG: lamin tail domain-containing protein, partial [Chlorobiales bacterium]|nr:lamin tail domain-containing protein [Chlorobiales bacterium]
MKKSLLPLALFLLFTRVAFSQWIINEIHADPDQSIAGDANGDGVREASDDEFVELVNKTGLTVDISGWTLSDGLEVRHVFPAGTVISNGAALVVFGGGTPTGMFGGSTVQVASSGWLALNNEGDVITLSNGVQTVVSYTYGSEAQTAESLTRDPDLVGAFSDHSKAAGSGGKLFSPGTQINGLPFAQPTKLSVVVYDGENPYVNSPFDVVIRAIDENGVPQNLMTTTTVQLTFTGGDPEKLIGKLSGTLARGASELVIRGFEYEDVASGLQFRASVTSGESLSDGVLTFNVLALPAGPIRGDIVLTEIMVNPKSTADAQGEYIEIFNCSNRSFSLDGYILKDDDRDSHTIASGGTLVLKPYSFLILASSNNPLGNGSLVPDYVYPYSDFQLGNIGDEIILTEPGNGKELVRTTYQNGDLAGEGTALEIKEMSLGRDGKLAQADYMGAPLTMSNNDKGSPGFIATIHESAPRNPRNGEKVTYGTGYNGDAQPVFEVTDRLDGPLTEVVSYTIFNRAANPRIPSGTPTIHRYVVLEGMPDQSAVAMYYSNAEFLNAGFVTAAESDLQLAAWGVGQWAIYPRAAGSDAGINRVEAENVGRFSEWVIFSEQEDKPLPVSLTNFTSCQQSTTVMLNWTTDSETDNLGFILLRNSAQIASYRSHPQLKGKGTTAAKTV